MKNSGCLRDMRSSIVWDVTKRRFIVSYWLFGQSIGHIVMGQALFLDCLTFEDGADMLCRNIGNQLATYAL